MKKFTHLPDTLNLNLKSKTESGQRFYQTPKGKIYPSITTVLKFYKEKQVALKEWKKRVGNVEASKIQKKAQERGISLHSLLEDTLKNKKINLKNAHNDVQIMFKQIAKHLNKVDNIHAQEISLYSDALGVAGRVDLIAEYDGILAIVDFKGSNKAKREEWIHDYFMQATAYAVMYYELTKKLPKKIVIVVGVNEPEYIFKGAQVFIESSKKYLNELQSVIKEYYEHHTIPATI